MRSECLVAAHALGVYVEGSGDGRGSGGGGGMWEGKVCSVVRETATHFSVHDLTVAAAGFGMLAAPWEVLGSGEVGVWAAVAPPLDGDPA